MVDIRIVIVAIIILSIILDVVISSKLNSSRKVIIEDMKKNIIIGEIDIFYTPLEKKVISAFAKALKENSVEIKEYGAVFEFDKYRLWIGRGTEGANVSLCEKTLPINPIISEILYVKAMEYINEEKRIKDKTGDFIDELMENDISSIDKAIKEWIS